MHPAGATGAREDGWQSVFRHTVHFCAREEGLLRFDPDAARWHWELDRVTPRVHDNVVDLMSEADPLALETQAALQQLACLATLPRSRCFRSFSGNRTKMSVGSVDAVRLELVEPWKLVQFITTGAGGRLFIHVERLRAEAHLRIGRLLAAHTSAEKREEAIFEIVNQLNRGVALITSPDEREQLAEFNC